MGSRRSLRPVAIAITAHVDRCRRPFASWWVHVQQHQHLALASGVGLIGGSQRRARAGILAWVPGGSTQTRTRSGSPTGTDSDFCIKEAAGSSGWPSLSLSSGDAGSSPGEVRGPVVRGSRLGAPELRVTEAEESGDEARE